MFERILVTGYSGFVGPWVVAELRRRFSRAEIFGAARQMPIAGRLPATPDRRLRLDLRDAHQVQSLVEEVRPDAVVHLAALKLASLEELLAVNVVGCQSLLTHLHEISPKARIIVIGSSAELGCAPACDVPLDEAAPCRPVDHYGVAKLAQSAIAGRQALHGQDVILLRPFNLIGPGMPDGLLAGRCARLLSAAADAPGPHVLEFGPLETRRDYVDVRDFARAVALALEKSPSGLLYHIGSGVSRSGHELVEALIRQSELDVTYRASEAAERSLVPWQTAAWSRARQRLGWQPTIEWQQSLADIWESARSSKRSAEMVALSHGFSVRAAGVERSRNVAGI